MAEALLGLLGVQLLPETLRLGASASGLCTFEMVLLSVCFDFGIFQMFQSRPHVLTVVGLSILLNVRPRVLTSLEKFGLSGQGSSALDCISSHCLNIICLIESLVNTLFL